MDEIYGEELDAGTKEELRRWFERVNLKRERILGVFAPEHKRKVISERRIRTKLSKLHRWQPTVVLSRRALDE
jgi:hypothetical protein